VGLLEAHKGTLRSSTEQSVRADVKKLLKGDHVWVAVTKAQSSSI
jgi:hypothetical protein